MPWAAGGFHGDDDELIAELPSNAFAMAEGLDRADGMPKDLPQAVLSGMAEELASDML